MERNWSADILTSNSTKYVNSFVQFVTKKHIELDIRIRFVD